MQRRHRSEEGASREPQPRNPREPGLREVAVEATRNKGQVNAKLHCVFYLNNHDCRRARVLQNDAETCKDQNVYATRT